MATRQPTTRAAATCPAPLPRGPAEPPTRRGWRTPSRRRCGAADVAAVLVPLDGRRRARPAQRPEGAGTRRCKARARRCCSTGAPTSSRAPAPMARISPGSMNSAPRSHAQAGPDRRLRRPRHAPRCDARRRGGRRLRDVRRAGRTRTPAVVRRRPRARRMVGEVFEIPCVGFAAHPDEIAALAAAGADFVAVGAFVFDDPRGPAAAMKDAQALPRHSGGGGMMRVRHRTAALLAGALSVALGASTIAQAQPAAPPIPPGNIPGRRPGGSPAQSAQGVSGDSRQRRRRTAGNALEIRARAQAPEAEAGCAPEADAAAPPPTPPAAAQPSHRAASPPVTPPHRRLRRRRTAALPSAVASRRSSRRPRERTRGCRLRRIPARPLQDRVDDRDRSASSRTTTSRRWRCSASSTPPAWA